MTNSELSVLECYYQPFEAALMFQFKLSQRRQKIVLNIFMFVSDLQTALCFKIQDDCTALIKENAAISAQVVELRKQIDMVSFIQLLKFWLFPRFFLNYCIRKQISPPFSRFVGDTLGEDV